MTAHTTESKLAEVPKLSVDPRDEADAILTALGLDPRDYRTESGALNLPRFKATLKYPADYPDGEKLAQQAAINWNAGRERVYGKTEQQAAACSECGGTGKIFDLTGDGVSDPFDCWKCRPLQQAAINWNAGRERVYGKAEQQAASEGRTVTDAELVEECLWMLDRGDPGDRLYAAAIRRTLASTLPAGDEGMRRDAELINDALRNARTLLRGFGVPYGFNEDAYETRIIGQIDKAIEAIAARTAGDGK